MRIYQTRGLSEAQDEGEPLTRQQEAQIQLRDPQERAAALAAWTCEGCGRGRADGAKPNRGSEHDKSTARLCQRCAMREARALLRQSLVPLDMPKDGGHGPRDPAVRPYWERRIFDAFLEAFAVPTDGQYDAAFRSRRDAAFALVVLGARYLKLHDYIRDSDVPRFLGCHADRHD